VQVDSESTPQLATKFQPYAQGEHADEVLGNKEDPPKVESI